MNTPLFLQRPGLGIAILRIVVGIVFFAHGLQKLLMFGIGGFTGFLTQVGVPLPGLFAVIVIAVEVLAGLALILGIATRWAALPLAVDMIVALLTVHLANGFFMSDNGIELVLTLLSATVALAFLGSGAFALDNVLFRERAAAPRTARAS